MADDQIHVTNKMVNVAMSAANSFRFADKSDRERMRAGILAALRHLPVGWQIVPKEPTQEMVEAGLATTAAWRDFSGSAYTVNRKKMTIRYKAMVAVTPAPTILEENPALGESAGK